MKVSIIIPIYRVEKYLEKCLDSVLNQTYKNIEIILVDDGSPDKCGFICDEYSKKDSRIIVVHQENKGLSMARNAGMELATGEYIYFIDSDDYISEETIFILIERAKKTNADIVIGNTIIVDEQNRISKKEAFIKEALDRDILKKSEEKYRYFLGKSYGTTAWNKLYKTTFIKHTNVKFEKNDLIYAEDRLFNLKLFINGPNVQLVNEYTYYYIFNSESLGRTFKKNLTQRYINLLNSFYNYAIKINKIDEFRDLFAYNVFHLIDSSCLNCYQYSEKIFIEMSNELRKFKKSEIICNAIEELAQGKYLREVPRNDWKYYALIFSVLYKFNFLNLITMLQIIRFKLFNKK